MEGGSRRKDLYRKTNPKYASSKCLVSNCCSTESRSYYRFPEDSFIRKLWMRACNLKTPVLFMDGLVCQYHFLQDDFVKDIQRESLGLPTRMKLKDDAVPSQNLNLTHVSMDHDYCKFEFCPEPPRKRTNVSKAVELALAHPSILSKTPSRVGIKLCQSTKEDSNIKLDRTVFKHTVLADKLKKQEKEYQSLKIKYENLKRESTINIRTFKILAANANTCSIGKVKETLKEYLTLSQINFIFDKSMASDHWEESEILHALILRRLSPNTYDYLRKNKLMPLPECSVLQKWNNHYESILGIQRGSLQHLADILRENMSDLNYNLCALHFGIFKLDDSKVVPIQEFLVANISSITHKWSIPIFLDVEVPVTKVLLTKIIHAVEDKGAIITSITITPEDSFHRLISECHISRENPYVTLSKDASRKVFMLADPLQAVRTFSYHLLQDGFEVLPAKKCLISKDIFEHFLRHKNIKFNHSRTPTNERKTIEDTPTNLLPIDFDLFSTETVDYLQNVDENIATNLVKNLGRWQQFFCPAECEFASLVLEEDKIGIISTVVKEMDAIRKPGFKDLLPCQLSIIITSHAFLQLFKHLKSEYSIKYILTPQLSLRAIQSIFEKLKGIDSSNLSPFSILQQLRSIVLGENLVFAKEESSTILSD